MVYSKAKLKSNCDRASPCFKPLLKGTRQTNACLPYCAMGFSQTHVYCRQQFHVDTKHNENIIQDLPPN